LEHGRQGTGGCSWTSTQVVATVRSVMHDRDQKGSKKWRGHSRWRSAAGTGGTPTRARSLTPGEHVERDVMEDGAVGLVAKGNVLEARRCGRCTPVELAVTRLGSIRDLHLPGFSVRSRTRVRTLQRRFIQGGEGSIVLQCSEVRQGEHEQHTPDRGRPSNARWAAHPQDCSCTNSRQRDRHLGYSCPLQTRHGVVSDAAPAAMVLEICPCSRSSCAEGLCDPGSPGICWTWG